jgi:uncharacterized alpha-E superfamily protein
VLSRIARGLCDLGRQIERAQHVIRVLEVNHKMNLERAASDDANLWLAISEAFGCEGDAPSEEDLYRELVLSSSHPYSVRHCIEGARDEGRAMRDHISEEMWLHLNGMHLSFARLTFDEVLRIGRSEFNRRIELFGDAFHGLADDTMIRGEAWQFLRIGRLSERAAMISRILEIKRKSLELAPVAEGAPLDVHQWQVLLRSLSAYEPYRRAYDARIVPERVLEFVMQRPDFPRSLTFTLRELRHALGCVSGSNPVQLQLERRVDDFLEDLRLTDPVELVRTGSFEGELHRIERRCADIQDELALGYFTSLRPASAPITASPGAGLVPQ